MTDERRTGCTVEVADGPCGHAEHLHKRLNSGEWCCWTCQEQARGDGRYAHLHEYRGDA